jgi:putative SOS response-associated peptidase YedK
MCGRYYRFATVDDIAAIFGAEVNTDQVVPPTFNASPDTWHPIIRMGREGRREIVLMRWGFIQKRAKDDVPAPSNAKSEGILTKWPFMRAIRTQRCIVPINGFYEWVRPESRPDDCPAWSHDRTCRPIGSTLGGQAGW